MANAPLTPKPPPVSIHIRQKESGNWYILGEARSSPLFSLFFPTVEIKVIKRERVQTSFGEVNAIKVRPELPFKTVQEQKGEFYAWFTDDQRRLPIKLQGGVVLGSMVGKLVEWQVDDKLIFRDLES